MCGGAHDREFMRMIRDNDNTTADFVKFLQENTHLNITEQDKWQTYLHVAADVGNVAATQAILRDDRAKAIINAKNMDGATPLVVACKNRHEKVVAELLQDHRIDPNIRDDNVRSPLYYTVASNNIRITQLLLSHPDIVVNDENAVDDGNTSDNMYSSYDIMNYPFLYACIKGYSEIVAEFLKHPSLKMTGSIYEYMKLGAFHTDIIQRIIARFPHLSNLKDSIIPMRRSISILPKSIIHRVIQFENDNGIFMVNTIRIPKGTVLFRLTTSKDVRDDFYGMTQGVRRYMHSNYHVFFYPYPFAAGYLSKKGFYHVFTLARDVEVVMAIEPSPNSRANRHHEGYISSCRPEHIKSSASNLYAPRDYDPCFDLNFIARYPEIVGYLGLAKGDTDFHLSDVTGKSKYWTYFRDAGVTSVNFNKTNGGMHNGRAIGVPEIVLHPLSPRSVNELIVPVDTTNAATTLPRGIAFNYKHIASFAYNSVMKHNKLEDVIDKYLSPQGYDGSHMTIDLVTKLYVLWEEADANVQSRCVPLEDHDKLEWLHKRY
jgi:ankyrin repeat protein